MISTSIAYFIFLAVTLLVFYITPVKFRNYILILASIVFYSYVRVSYLFIIFSIIIVNYFIGIRIENSLNKKLRTYFLYFSLFLNIGILIYFKYWNFIIDTIFAIPGSAFFKNNLIINEIVLPLGLSYYIFQTIGYIFDVYRGSLKAEKDFSKFALFTLFFPKLLVGPIERAKNLFPQFNTEHPFYRSNIVEGCNRIIWGLFKKLVVADRISIYVDAVYSNIPQHNSTTFYVATFLYPFQVYSDFSGYTDIAIGTAKLFGIDLIENFKRPLLAKNISDFWRRWHISLSSWVNDYIYTPIVLKRRDWGNWGVFYALVLSFTVIGIWHGASWNFVIFGMLQASAIMLEVLTTGVRKKISKIIPTIIYRNASILLTFLFFTFSLIIFRTTSLTDAENILNIAFSNNGRLYIDQPSTIIFILIGIVIILINDIRKENHLIKHLVVNKENQMLHQMSYSIMLIYIILAGVFDGGQFIYFAF